MVKINLNLKNDKTSKNNSQPSIVVPPSLKVINKISDLSDVDVSNVNDGDTLVYNESTGKWESASGGGSGGGGCVSGKTDCVIWENIQTLDNNYIVDENRNAMMVGPINTGTYALYVPANSLLKII